MIHIISCFPIQFIIINLYPLTILAVLLLLFVILYSVNVQASCPGHTKTTLSVSLRQLVGVVKDREKRV